MARHATTKSTAKGRHITCSRRAARWMKYASPALDIPALEHELGVVRGNTLADLAESNRLRRTFGTAA